MKSPAIESLEIGGLMNPDRAEILTSAKNQSAVACGRELAGLSHRPDEQTSPGDLEVALRVTVDFPERLARKSSS
jgi:hypothetical protein